MTLGGGDAAILGGTFLLALAVMRVLEKMIATAADKKRNGNGHKSGPVTPIPMQPDECDECRRTVMQSSWTMKQIVEGQGKQLEVLGEIRDGVRDLTRTPTGKFTPPYEG